MREFLKLSFKIVFILISCPLILHGKDIQFVFYSEKVSFQMEYIPKVNCEYRKKVTRKYIDCEQQIIKELVTDELVSTFKNYKSKWKLNDWLFYEFVNKYSYAVFNEDANSALLLTYNLLANLGYKIKISYNSEQLFILSYSLEKTYEFYQFPSKRGNWIILNTFQKKINSEKIIDYECYDMKDRKDFSFLIREIPSLPHSERMMKYSSLKIEGYDEIKIGVEINKTYVEVLKNYPLLTLESYYLFPNSENIIDDILMTLDSYLINKNTFEKSRLILSFSRTSTQYLEDKNQFGVEEKPMVLDEIFYFENTDCEDRSLLLFHLLKKVVNLPMIVVKYKNHINIGIGLKKGSGDQIKYKGKKYTVLEPSDYLDNSDIGHNGKSGEPYEVIFSYSPNYKSK